MILNGTYFNSEKTFWFSEMLLGLLVIWMRGALCGCCLLL